MTSASAFDIICIESEGMPMTTSQRNELRDLLASIVAQRQALEADTPSEPAESPCEDEATEWGEDTPTPESDWLDF